MSGEAVVPQRVTEGQHRGERVAHVWRARCTRCAPMSETLPPPFARESGDVVNVVVETPAGSRIKYTWQPDLRLFKATRVLGSGMRFPHDCGFIPGTETAEGSPLDALILSDGPLEVGCLVECRVLGAFAVSTDEQPGVDPIRNDRLVVVPLPSRRGRDWKELGDLGDAAVGELADFLRTYVEREGRSYRLEATVDSSQALGVVRRSLR